MVETEISWARMQNTDKQSGLHHRIKIQHLRNNINEIKGRHQKEQMKIGNAQITKNAQITNADTTNLWDWLRAPAFLLSSTTDTLFVIHFTSYFYVCMQRRAWQRCCRSQLFSAKAKEDRTSKRMLSADESHAPGDPGELNPRRGIASRIYTYNRAPPMQTTGINRSV